MDDHIGTQAKMTLKTLLCPDKFNHIQLINLSQNYGFIEFL